MTSPGGDFLEGLLGGAQGGYGFREQIKDRKRERGIQDENLMRQRAQDLRNQVAFDLERKVREGQLREQQTSETVAADRRTRIKTAADAIRANPTLAQHPIIGGLLNLPDEDLVTGVMDLATHPERLMKPDGSADTSVYSEPGEPVGVIDRGRHTFAPVMGPDGKPVVRGINPALRSANQREDLHSVERQVDDTRTDLGRAERDMPKPNIFQRGVAATPADSARFTADSTGAASLVNRLRQRSDSLGVVRDSIAGVVQGRRPGPSTGRASSRRGAPDNLVKQIGQQFNWDEAKVRQELMRRGYDPDAQP